MLPALADTPQNVQEVSINKCFLTAPMILTTDFYSKVDVEHLLKAKYPEMTNLLMDLIDCESGFNPSKCGDSGVSCGILQIQEQTFKDWSCNGEWKDSENQVDCSVPVIKSGIGSTTEGWYNCWRIKNLFKYGY
jgi:hypothetical protein